MESAILLCVPEAEALVHEWRLKGDPSAAHGVPAHVTLLYPFLPVESLDEGVLAELAWFFRGIDAFPVRFTSVQRWEDAGADQLTFGMLSQETPIDVVIEATELFGREVIPRFDTDPAFRSDRLRREQVGATA